MIRCDCAVCRSPDPRDQRTRASIYLETPELAFVVDTGTDFRTQCLRENIWSVDAAHLYPFAHRSHDGVRRSAALRARRAAGACQSMPRRKRWPICSGFTNLPSRRSSPWPGYLKPEPHIVCGPFSLGKTLITPLPVPHGSSETSGYLFSRDGVKLAAYLSDCSAVPEEIARQIEGVKVMVIDALRHKPHPTHLSVEQALEVAARIRPGANLFTHICHELAQSAEADLPPGAGIAYDGLKLEFAP